MGWDGEIDSECLESWSHWVQDLPNLANLQVQCSLTLPSDGSFKLDVFADASKEAYATVAYVWVPTKEGIIKNIVMATTRVTPLKAHSIPRLELMAASIAVRMARLICEVLDCNLSEVTLWSDSINVLYWLKRSSKQFGPFVANQ